MIIGISGVAGAGKDTAADFLVKSHGYVKVSLADPLKRICQEVFAFTDEQLWGGSNKRDEPDHRYASEWFHPTDPTQHSFQGYLTPRYALQRLGTEWGRECYKDVWVDYALRVADMLLSNRARYDAKLGVLSGGTNIEERLAKGVVIPDVRFRNEIAAIKKAGGKVVRIYRQGSGLKGAAAEHASEAEQLDIPDSEFHHIIDNSNGPLSALEQKVAEMVKCLS